MSGGGLEVKVEHIGAEREPLIVVDNFFDDLPGLFEYATTQCAYSPVQGHLYPGVRAQAPDAYARYVVRKLGPALEDVFGFAGWQIQGVESDFSIVTTPRNDLRLMQCIPHFDTTHPYLIAVLHYISARDYGGTSFYRHRDTGFESVGPERHDAYMAALGESLKTHGAPRRDYIDGDTPIFERLASVAGVRNRLVAYRSAILHSGDISADCPFDGDPRTGRLTVNTFIGFRPPA